MSEYQYYEFVALDRPLTSKQMTELRAISTRAEITPTRFQNEYNWGNLKTDPKKLLERYFDAHLYFTNWGTHRLMLRLPKSRVDERALRPYFPSVRAARCQMSTAGEHILLDLQNDLEEPEWEDETTEGVLATLTPLRAELMRGDLRPAYLAWLVAVQSEDVKPGATEPPVPPGLATLSAAQQAMVDFLRIDEDLLEAASASSAQLGPSDDRFRSWVMSLPQDQKDNWLLRAAEEPELALGSEMLRAFRATTPLEKKSGSRTVAELNALAEEKRRAREDAERAREKKAEQAATRKRKKHLDEVARDVEGAWSKLEELVEKSAYDDAVKLAVDLRDLASRDGDLESFQARLKAMRKRQSRRRSFFERWSRVTAAPPPE